MRSTWMRRGVIGGKQGHIIMRHILPNIMAPLVILATLSLSLPSLPKQV